jgi:hypothetical protein
MLGLSWKNRSGENGQNVHHEGAVSEPGAPPASSPTGTLLGFISIGLGGVLILAAALKAHQLLAGRAPGAGWRVAAVVQVELLAGLALLLGLYPAATRWGAMLLFACFVGVSCYQVSSGAKSCGCLGDVRVPACRPTIRRAVGLCCFISVLPWRCRHEPL